MIMPIEQFEMQAISNCSIRVCFEGKERLQHKACLLICNGRNDIYLRRK